MSQEQFDNEYNKGIEANKISLTDSKEITTNDMLDSAIFRLYFQEGKNIEEIQEALNKKLKDFQKDLKDFL